MKTIINILAALATIGFSYIGQTSEAKLNLTGSYSQNVDCMNVYKQLGTDPRTAVSELRKDYTQVKMIPAIVKQCYGGFGMDAK